MYDTAARRVSVWIGSPSDVIDRLGCRLRERGWALDVRASVSSDRGFALGRSPLGRLIFRLGSMIVFPLRALAGSPFGKAAVLVPVTNPFFLPFLFVVARPLHRRPVVPLLYDLWPDALEAAGLAKPSSGLARLVAWSNRLVFSRADAVVFIGERMGEHARRRYGEPKRWIVAETGAELAEFAPEALGPADPESDLERWCAGRLVLSYVGNMGRMHDWETLAAAIPRVIRETGKRVGVVLAASGPGVEYLRGAWADMPPGSVRFELAGLGQRTWARLLTLSHIALVTLRDSARHVSIPSKAFSAMAARNALLAVAPRDSDVADVVVRHRCGVLVRPGDADGATAALLELVQDRPRLETFRRNAHAAVAACYDMPILAERWAGLLSEVAPIHTGRAKR